MESELRVSRQRPPVECGLRCFGSLGDVKLVDSLRGAVRSGGSCLGVGSVMLRRNQKKKSCIIEMTNGE